VNTHTPDTSESLPPWHACLLVVPLQNQAEEIEYIGPKKKRGCIPDIEKRIETRYVHTLHSVILD